LIGTSTAQVPKSILSGSATHFQLFKLDAGKGFAVRVIPRSDSAMAFAVRLERGDGAEGLSAKQMKLLSFL
jgi:hypothetical protein